MRIVSLSHLFPNRAKPTNGLFVYERIRHLAQLAEVTVIAPVGALFPALVHRYSYVKCVPPQDILSGLPVLHPRFTALPVMSFLVPSLLCRRLMNNALCRDALERCDIIDIHWTFPEAYCGYLISRKLNKPFAVTIRGEEAFYQGRGTIRENQLGRAFRSASGIIVVSNELQKKTTARYELKASRVHAVENGVDTAFFCPGDKMSARADLGIAAEGPICLSVGFLSERKGFHHIIDQWNRVLSFHNRARLYIAGDPGAEGSNTYAVRLQRAVVSHGLEKSVLFLGGVLPEVLRVWYRAADVFVLATAREGCPNVVLEAQATGVPVVATAVGAIPDIVSEGVSGLLVDPANIDIAAALCRALSKQWNTEEISDRFKQRTWHVCARNHLARLKESICE